jgi:hypothetical protein
LDQLGKNQNLVGPTPQSHGPNGGTQAAPTASRQRRPPPHVALRGAHRRGLLLSSPFTHASPLLSSPFASATAAPDTDALECPSNAAEQEHHPHAVLLPRAGHCEESPKPPHAMRHFHQGRLIDGRHLWPPLTLVFTTIFFGTRWR